jgi:hypothetical protein
MKLTIEQIKALAAATTSTSRSRVADVMIKAATPLSKTEIAKLAQITGARPEHNVSSQFTYLRTEGYILKEIGSSTYMILGLPNGDVPEYAVPIVMQALGIKVEEAPAEAPAEAKAKK